jgi:hypothetical protein
MKRIAVFCLICAALIACQPTPETEYVVGRQDYETIPDGPTDDAPHALQAESWAETVTPEKGCLTEIRIDVTIPALPAEAVPMIKATPVSFDAATVKAVSEYLVPNAALSLKTVTKADLTQQIQESLAALDRADDMEFESDEARTHYKAELLQEIEELKALYAEADDEATEPVSYESLCARDKADFLLLDLSGITEAQCRLTCGIERGDPRSSKLHVTLTDYALDLSGEATTDDAVIRACEEVLAGMGITGYTFNHADAISEKRMFIFTKQISGIPYSRATDSTGLMHRESEELSAEPFWLDDSIRFTVAEGKLLAFDWLSKTEYGEKLRSSVPLLSVEQAKQRIINGLVYQYSVALTNGEASHRIQVTEVQFGYKRIPTSSGARDYAVVPAWTVMGMVIPKYASSADAPDLILNADNERQENEEAVLLVLNAIDGNIIG